MDKPIGVCPSCFGETKQATEIRDDEVNDCNDFYCSVCGTHWEQADLNYNNLDIEEDNKYV